MRIVGVGAGGHAKVLMDIVRLMPGLDLVGVLDVNAARWGTEHYGAPVLGDETVLPTLGVDGVFIGIGGVPSNAARRRAFERVRAMGFPIVTLVHPAAIVATGVRLGEGVMIMGGAVVNPDAVLGDGVIVNTRAVVEHDCVVGDFAHICPGTVLGGSVTVGEEAFVGIGSTVIQGVRIGARAVIGGGSVVLKHVRDDVMAVGHPVRVVKELAARA